MSLTHAPLHGGTRLAGLLGLGVIVQHAAKGEGY